MKRSFYHYRGFSGPDVSIEISLTEYGIAWKEIKKDKFEFIYQIEFSPYRFDYGFMTREEFHALCAEDWFELPAVLAFCGVQEEEFLAEFPLSIHTALQYHGYENIFGLSYTEGFQIS